MSKPGLEEHIEYLLWQEDDPQRQREGILRLDSAEALQVLVEHYNWDDGFEIPTLIANHSKCDLAVALQMYWLAESDYALADRPEERKRNPESAWAIFGAMLTERLVNGYYRRGTASYEVDLMPVHFYKLRKRGFPEVLLTHVVGEATAATTAGDGDTTQTPVTPPPQPPPPPSAQRSWWRWRRRR